MSYNRAIPSHLRSGSLSNAGSSTGQSSALQARISEKKQELASLKELQSLSAGLADQMEQLEQKLATLSDGTEAVATVLSNWHNVLRAISMASSMCDSNVYVVSCADCYVLGAIPKPKESEDGSSNEPLPQTLVRIPTQHVGAIQQEASAGASAD
jgi:DASH complex subunit DAD2